MAQKKARSVPAGVSRPRSTGGRRTTDIVHGTWSSGFVFVLAVTGAALGLNSFWQFPYLAAHNGGGIFLLVFLLALILVTVPMLMAETVIGRLAGTLPTAAVRRLAAQDNCRSAWIGIGVTVTVTGFLVFTYLCVIGSWTWAYAVRAAVGVFDGRTLDGTLSQFFSFTGDPERQLFWHATFLLTTGAVVARGVNLGVEPVVRYGVPAMLVAIGLLAIYGLSAGDASQAVSSLLDFQSNLFDYHSISVAVAEAVFCAGIGVGVVWAYGSYLKPGVSIARTSVAISAIIAVMVVLVSLFVIAVLSATGQKPVPGPTLLFQALPYALVRLTGGDAASTLMYITVGAATWFSAIALIEAPIGWVRDRIGVNQTRATVLVLLVSWIVGVVVILSFNYWAFPFRLFGAEKRLGIFDILQLLTADLLIPVGLLLVALFAGWGINRVAIRNELDLRWPLTFRVWLYLSRVVVPFLLFVLVFFLPGMYR
jgi:NSS family neurotransmitter:Na+ symporter